MGFRGDAAVVGFQELAPQKVSTRTPRFTLEQWATLGAAAIADAGLTGVEIDGIVTSTLLESEMFVPSTIAEYLGARINFAETVDLGGASAAAMVWRAAAAVELGICQAVLCVIPAD